jgi:hypothetical protein
MSLLKTNEIQNYNGSSLTLTASTVSTSAQLNTGGNISVTGSLNVSDDSTTRTNLGLGTIATQDSDSITVTGGTATLGALTVSGSDSGDLVRITQTGSGNALVVEDSANPDSTPFVVDSSGNVGIGTASLTYNLHIKESTNSSAINLQTDGSGGCDVILQATRSGAALIGVGSSNGALSFGTGNSTGIGSTERMRIDGSGNIGAPSGTNIYNASDQRLKQNITDLSGCLQKVLLMRGVSFNWIDNFCDSEADKTLYGLIAQELQTVDVNLVDSFSDNTITAGQVTVENPLRVNEKFIIPMLVESIKEQQTLIESQQSQIDELTARIEALETN